MSKQLKLKLVGLCFLILSSTHALSETNQKSCELIDGYYFGMSLEDAKANYNKTSQGNLEPTRALNLSSSPSTPYTYSGAKILGVGANVEVVFDTKYKLTMLTAKFHPKEFTTIKQALINSFGAPKATPCGNPELYKSTCESLIWDTNLALVWLNPIDTKWPGLSSLLIGPSGGDGRKSKIFSKCMSSIPPQPEHLPSKLGLPNKQLEAGRDDGISEGDKQFISCIYPKVIKGKYSVNDSLEELTPVLSACNSEFETSMNTCIESGKSNVDCARKAMLFLHMAVKSVNEHPKVTTK